MEDQKALQAGALVSKLADPIGDDVDNLLADSVMATGVVVRCIFFASDELLRVKKLSENRFLEKWEMKKKTHL